MKSTIVNSLANRSENPVKGFVAAFNPTDLLKEVNLILSLDEDFENYPTVTFQISLGWKSTPNDRKFDFNRKPGTGLYNGVNLTGWGKIYPSTDKPGYNGCDWHTVTTSLNVLPLLSEAGFVVRFGIKEGSNDKDDFEFAEFIGFDLDKDPSMTWEGTLEKCRELGIEPLVIYYSPSGDETNNKLRMFLYIDRRMTYQEYWEMAKRIGHQLPNCNPIPTANQFWYGTVKPLLYVSPFNAPNSYEFLDSGLPELTDEQRAEQQQDKQENKEIVDSEEITVKRRAYITEKIVNEKFNGDYTQLVDEWIDELNKNGGNLYKGGWFERGSQNGSIDTKNGTDPILGGDSVNSDSFVVSLQPDGSIMVTSRKHGDIGGDLVWLHHKLEYGSWDVADMTNKEYKQRYLSILKKYDVDPELFYPTNAISYLVQLDWAINRSVKEFEDEEGGKFYSLCMKSARSNIAPRLLACAFFESMDGRLNRSMPPKNSGAISYLYYNGKQWVMVDIDYVMTLYSDWVVTLDINHTDLKDKVPLHFGTLHFDQVRKMIINIAQEFRTSDLPPIDTFWLGLNDCLIHTLNKKELTENPDRINCRMVLDMNYEQYKHLMNEDSSPILDELVEECSSNLEYPEQKVLIRPLAIITILGLLQYTGMGVLSMGVKGAFKSTLPELCGEVMGNITSKVGNYGVFRGNRVKEFVTDSHARSLVEHANLILLDDAESFNEMTGLIRDYLLGRIDKRNGSLVVDLNQKNEKRRSARVTWGFWITCNDSLFAGVRADKKTLGALARRLVCLIYKKSTKRVDKEFISNFLDNGRREQLIIECIKEFNEEMIYLIGDLENKAPELRALMDKIMLEEARKTSDMHLVDECMVYEEGFVIPIDLLATAERVYKAKYGGNINKDSHLSLKAYYDYIRDVLGYETKNEKFRFDWKFKSDRENQEHKTGFSKAGLLNMRFTEEFEQALSLTSLIVTKNKYTYYGREAMNTVINVMKNPEYVMN